MEVQRIAAFSQDEQGGNPAGVVLLDEPIPEAEMARIAAEVGYSETAFAVQKGSDGKDWRVRYFAPESILLPLRLFLTAMHPVDLNATLQTRRPGLIRHLFVRARSGRMKLARARDFLMTTFGCLGHFSITM